MKIVLPTKTNCFTSWFKAETPFAQEFSIPDQGIVEFALELSATDEDDDDIERLYERSRDAFWAFRITPPPALCRDSDEFRDLAYDIRMEHTVREGIERGRELHVLNQTRW